MKTVQEDYMRFWTHVQITSWIFIEAIKILANRCENKKKEAHIIRPAKFLHNSCGF